LLLRINQSTQPHFPKLYIVSGSNLFSPGDNICPNLIGSIPQPMSMSRAILSDCKIFEAD
jgi:hypothetical protein